MYESYEKKLGHQADFKVSYRFYEEIEGGRKTIPCQGYRSDFFYEHPDHNSRQNILFMIWPEFENESGQLILENNISVNREGIARMWIIMPERRLYHLDKIKSGLKGYFMEGSRRVAECVVTEILGLSTNPVQ